MSIVSKEEMEDLLRKVLSVQREVINLAKSLSDDPATQALILHTACNLVLDDQEDGSEELAVFNEFAPRFDAVVDLGYSSVLKTLEDGSYDRVFSVSVEIAANEITARLESCEVCESMESEEETKPDVKFGLN